MKKSPELMFKQRHRVVGFFIFAMFAVMAARATYLHILDQDFLRKEGDARMLRDEEIVAHRGILRDRNGQPLAVSTPVKTIWINPKLAKGLDVDRLADALSLSRKDLREKLKNNANKGFLYLKRHMAPEAADAVLAENFPGVYGKTEFRRFYPEGEVTSHLLGFTNLDDKGQEGLELELDEQLRGVSGSRRVLLDRKGQIMKDVALLSPAQPGKDVYLSFDTRIQYLAYRELAEAVEKSGAKAGSAVAIDIETGEVLAMANQPSFNPNNRKNLRPDELRNRAVTDMFEPGSTIKPFAAAAALESGRITTKSLFDTNPGTYKIYDKLVRDTHNYGVLDLHGAITKSSNVVMAQISEKLPRATLPNFYSRMGFGQKTGSGFPGESAGMLQPSSNWRPVELATMSYGYGMTTTALQLAHAYATLASGGVSRPVTFMRQQNPVAGERVLSETVAHQIMPMMESVVSADGTAVRAAVPGYRVAGKTGTAHKPLKDRRGYAANEYMSTFVGVAPVSRPKIALVVVVDSPSNGQYYGGLVSAPVFSRIMAEALRLMSVEPDHSAEHLAQQGVPPVRPPMAANGRGV